MIINMIGSRVEGIILALTKNIYLTFKHGVKTLAIYFHN